jgi:amidase
MLGVIGLAPAGRKPIPTMPAGKHGGNLDNKRNGIGCVIHLPVKHPGALLSVGDMHASQGDGEICGTGVEVGGHVLLRCEIIQQKNLMTPICEYPVTETETHWITHGVAVEDIPKATTVACEEACTLLMSQWGFSAEEAFIFLSVKGDLGLCQSCHPDQGTQIAKMTVPKIEACPGPFRLCEHF